MAKSDARFEYRANLNREVHNLGEPFGFTCAPGQLLPCFADIATPGDTYYINHDLDYLRTLPLTAPAMIDVKVHLESFFVPFQMIYQPFEETIFSLKSPQSSNYEISSLKNNSFPVGNFQDLRSTNFYGGSYKHSKFRFDAFRLSDMLGMNAYAFAFDANYPSIFSYCPNVFPWQLLAYHTIFQYYYRLDDKSQFSNNACNWDFWYNATSPVNLAIDMHEVHQRPWEFDYFTSSYRSPIVSDANIQNVMSLGTYSDLSSYGTRSIDRSGVPTNTNSLKSAFVGAIGSSYDNLELNSAISTALVRQMFANEKLAMITGRARKTYDAQVLAHFGVKVPHDPKHDIAFIGQDIYDLKVGEVTSLSSTSGAGLGELAGKGWAVGQSKGHKFTAPCHGIVMTIFSIEPKKRYFGEYNRINALTNAFDIPTPEFDRLGNMPMFRFETGERNGSGVVTDTDIVAWKERYYWNKRRHAKATLAFMNNRPVSLGYNEKSSYMLTSAPFGAYTGTNNNTARPELESRYYIDTNCMDAMLLQPYIGIWQNGETGEEVSENWNKTPWLAYARDPFIVNLDMKIKKVSWMSKDGEPIYNF